MSDCTNCTGRNTAVSSDGTDAVDKTCPAVGYQKVDVCVPVTVIPFANAQTTTTHCCGDPVVVSGDTPCSGIKNGVCVFTITQTLCIEIPVEFGAAATVGEAFVDCLGADSEDICKNCGKEAETV